MVVDEKEALLNFVKSLPDSWSQSLYSITCIVNSSYIIEDYSVLSKGCFP